MARAAQSSRENGDLSIAYKVLASAQAGLNATEIFVASAILRHLGSAHDTCFPSIDRLAEMARAHRTNVIKATKKLCTGEHRLFDKFKDKRNGANMNYTPRWHRFREINTQIESEFFSKNDNVSDAASSASATSHSSASATLTPLHITPLSPTSHTNAARAKSKPTTKPKRGMAWESDVRQFMVVRGGRVDVRRKSPEALASERWNDELRSSVGQATLAAIYEWMTPEANDEVTSAERNRFGLGIAQLRKMLFEAGRLDLAAAIGVSSQSSSHV